jgi:quercetin dioxygenase-like cupin family protein
VNLKNDKTRKTCSELKSTNGYVEILPGVSIKTISYGKNMLTTEFVLKKGSELPLHKHPNEQAGYLVKGNIILYIDGAARNLKPGDSWNIGGNIEHKAEISVSRATTMVQPGLPGVCRRLMKHNFYSSQLTMLHANINLL